LLAAAVEVPVMIITTEMSYTRAKLNKYATIRRDIPRPPRKLASQIFLFTGQQSFRPRPSHGMRCRRGDLVSAWL
jgi:hypothetical protein